MKFILLLFSLVSGHGYISNPPAQYYDNSKKTTYNNLIDSSIDSHFIGPFNWDPDTNLKSFTNSFKNTIFKDLKSMFEYANVKCGNSRIDINPIDVRGITSMSWQNDEERVGFIKSHSGPCEIWIDDIRITHDDDCRRAYPNYPANIPVDYNQCQGKCILQFYWLALHEVKWQMYKQCVPIINDPSPVSSVASTLRCEE